MKGQEGCLCTSARLNIGLCDGAPAGPDVMDEARRVSFADVAALPCTLLSLNRLTACMKQKPLSYLNGPPWLSRRFKHH